MSRESPPQALRVLLAPDSFKGSLPAADVAAHLAAGLRRSGSAVVADELPVADGGEGTVAAALAAGYQPVETVATGPLGARRRTRYAVDGSTAVIEMAAVSGLEMVDPTPAGALDATSRGVGELVRHALDRGVRTVVLGVGGSASTDGGAGLLSALGVRLRGAGGPVPDGGGGLSRITDVDLAGLDPRLRDVRLVLAGDVDNPLLGPSGAAAVFGPQKGADPQSVAALEAGLEHWVEVLTAAGLPHAAQHAASPGAGAAGGVGFAALTALGAERRPGVEVVLELADFGPRVRQADLVVTGEGSLDRQSLHGKAPVGVARAAAAEGRPTVAVCGRTELTGPELREAGIRTAYALTTFEPDPERCVRRAAPLLEQVGEQIARDLPALVAGKRVQG